MPLTGQLAPKRLGRTGVVGKSPDGELNVNSMVRKQRNHFSVPASLNNACKYIGNQFIPVFTDKILIDDQILVPCESGSARAELLLLGSALIVPEKREQLLFPPEGALAADPVSLAPARHIQVLKFRRPIGKDTLVGQVNAGDVGMRLHQLKEMVNLP